MSLIPFAGAVQKFNRQRGGYQIERSLRFNSADSAYLSRTPGSAPTLATKGTWSFWIKRTKLATEEYIFGSRESAGGNASTSIRFESNDTLRFLNNNGSGLTWNIITTQVFRDPGSWMHFVISLDTTQATDTNRIKIYVNGVQVTAFGTASYPSQDATMTRWAANGIVNAIGSEGETPGVYGHYYLAETYYIDGQALAPTDFGEFNEDTGVWQPKAYTGSYGTNGFYLDFADNTSTTTLGYDAAGSNDWTLNNFSVTAGADNDSLVDSPMRYGTDTGLGAEVRGNYATLNALDNAGVTLSNGNLTASLATAAYRGARATFAIPATGKWYWEINVTSQSASAGDWFIVGMVASTVSLSAFAAGYVGAIVYGDRNDASSGIFNGTSTVYQGTAILFATGDVLQCAYDADTGKFWFGKNNLYWNSSAGTTGDPATGANQTLTAATNTYFPFVQFSGTHTADMNFGQRPFAYTAPSGFKALCTTNLPEPTIADGSQYFNPVLWTGADTNGGNSVTGVGFSPDLVWAKVRSQPYSPLLYDRLRGTGGTAELATDQDVAEGGSSSSERGYLNSFDADGFSTVVGTNGDNLYFNQTSQTYVAWNWKANGSGVSNTAGSISSTVSVNTTSGFSIVTWTGNGSGSSTVGHGLGVVPSFIILKFRNAASSWSVYTASLGNTKRLTLESTAGEATNIGYWNNTSPTSTVFTLGSALSQAYTMVAYCFAPVAGYSAFGSYTGNNSADGPFVFTGFRPAYILIKSTASGTDWCTYDAKRLGYNVDNNLQRNVAAVEQTDDDIDFLSNGFKFRRASPNFNGSSTTHIYAAFAENPFAYALAR